MDQNVAKVLAEIQTLFRNHHLALITAMQNAEATYQKYTGCLPARDAALLDTLRLHLTMVGEKEEEHSQKLDMRLREVCNQQPSSTTACAPDQTTASM